MTEPNTPEATNPVTETFDAGPLTQILTEPPLDVNTYVAVAPSTENLPADQ